MQNTIRYDFRGEMMMRFKIIETDAQHEQALAMLGALIDSDPKPGSEEAGDLEVLAVLIESYEDNHFPMDEPDPIEAIKFRMDQMGLSNKDMIPYFGSKARVSEVLNGKRPLGLGMIRKLHKSLGVPADVLLTEPKAHLIEEEYDWEKFPIKRMLDHKYFSRFSLLSCYAVLCKHINVVIKEWIIMHYWHGLLAFFKK